MTRCSSNRPGVANKLCLPMHALLISIAGWVMPAAADTPLERHLQHMATDSDHWVTPNPDYTVEQGGPEQFSVTLQLTPDRSHAVG